MHYLQLWLADAKNWGMTMTDFDTQDNLDGLFAAAKEQTHDLPTGLKERILNDAGQVQDGFNTGLPTRSVMPSLFQGLRDLLGGWPGIAGLMTACTAGIWLGFSPPNVLPDALVISGFLQEDLDMYVADGLAAGWIEYSLFTENQFAE